jgi:hypothetical protein
LEHIDEYSSTTALSYHLQHQEPATWLTDGFRERVFAYMAGTTKELNGFALKVGGFYDHSLLLIRVTVWIVVSDFVGKLNYLRMSI